MSNKTHNVVSDYLNNLLMDLTVQEPSVETFASDELQPCDSINLNQRMLPCFDPFQFMSIDASFNQGQLYLTFLAILKTCRSLPHGRVKQYCLQQCQVLLRQMKLKGH